MAGVDLVFVWHFHQPDGRDPVGLGDLALPWVRLHATAAYTDLAALFEQHERLKATVDFSPILLQQLDDLTHGRCGDRLLDLCTRRAEDLSLHDRISLLRTTFMVDWERTVRPLPRFWELLHKRGRDLRAVDLERTAHLFEIAELRDLQVLSNLVWMGSAARQEEASVRRLLHKGRDFTEVEKEVLFECQHRLLSKVIPRWRALAERGQVELSTGPLHHAILPALLNPTGVLEQAPRASLPASLRARPDDVSAQLEEGAAVHRRLFCSAATGLFPPEAALCDHSLRRIGAAGFAWTLGDEQSFLAAALPEGERPSRDGVYKVWYLAPAAEPAEPGQSPAAANAPKILFRDRQLSDRLGFSYGNNSPEDAVADFIEHVEHVASLAEEGQRGPQILCVALDAETPWDHYPEGGAPFLKALANALENAQARELLQTKSAGSACAEALAQPLLHLPASSWIEGRLTAWMGTEETRLPWELLAATAEVFDARAGDMAPENRAEALGHLLAAEASDWFWWYGDDYLTETPELFDELFRAHLCAVYRLTGERTPPRLRHPLSDAAAGAARALSVRRPTSAVTPIIDGIAAPHIDWMGAGRYRPPPVAGSMFRTSPWVDKLYFGADLTELYLRLDPLPVAQRSGSPRRLELQVLAGDRECKVAFALETGTQPGQALNGCIGEESVGRLCFDAIVELALPLASMGLRSGQLVHFALTLLERGVELERLPRYGHLSLSLPRQGPATEETA